MEALFLNVARVRPELVVADRDSVPVGGGELATQTDVVEPCDVPAAHVTRHVHREVVNRGERHHSVGGGGGGGASRHVVRLGGGGDWWRYL